MCLRARQPTARRLARLPPRSPVRTPARPGTQPPGRSAAWPTAQSPGRSPAGRPADWRPTARLPASQANLRQAASRPERGLPETCGSGVAAWSSRSGPGLIASARDAWGRAVSGHLERGRVGSGPVGSGRVGPVGLESRQVGSGNWWGRALSGRARSVPRGSEGLGCPGPQLRQAPLADVSGWEPARTACHGRPRPRRRAWLSRRPLRQGSDPVLVHQSKCGHALSQPAAPLRQSPVRLDRSNATLHCRTLPRTNGTIGGASGTTSTTGRPAFSRVLLARVVRTRSRGVEREWPLVGLRPRQPTSTIPSRQPTPQLKTRPPSGPAAERQNPESHAWTGGRPSTVTQTHDGHTLWTRGKPRSQSTAVT
jgi:hypothetical protein